MRVGSSCESILSVEGNSPDGIYFLSTPSVMPTMCDMSTDDGGWTAFYLSTNGEPAAGALSFEGETTYGYGPSDHDLQFLFGRPPEDITTDSWFMAQCGDKKVKFQVTQQTIALFKDGQQGQWQPLSNVTALPEGSLNYLPTHIWTGGTSDSANGDSWILTSNPAGDERLKTFSSASGNDSSWDYCDGVPDVDSSIFLFYR